MSLIFSAVISVGKLVLAQGTAGNSEASTTRRPGDAAHPALIVGDRHRVAVRAHAAGAGGMPDADRGLADEFLQRVVVGHQLVEAIPLDDKPVDDPAAQPFRPVEQLRDDAVSRRFLSLTTPIWRTRSL